MKMMWLSLAAFIPAILAMPTTDGKLETTDVEFNATAAAEAALLACGCVHNNDAGRWDDSMSPGDRIADLCRRGGGCHRAAIGNMCVHGDMGQCGCAAASGKEWESCKSPVGLSGTSGPASSAVACLLPSLASGRKRSFLSAVPTTRSPSSPSILWHLPGYWVSWN
ncbi:hypothetical protein B0T21DRAFT_288631 [Apiosordaria backusii]|uniref:Uncharacterized protein n=1 Tax=Apiosordaria backusii TaxID=314023 RepID=A0AA40BLY7_9PEZI|nr:hypothetical protein B0T21DRAFT_288631 [Apiosordaria backusii]